MPDLPIDPWEVLEQSHQFIANAFVKQEADAALTTLRERVRQAETTAPTPGDELLWHLPTGYEDYLTIPELADPDDPDDGVWVIQTQPGYIFDDVFWDAFHRCGFHACHVAYYGPARLAPLLTEVDGRAEPTFTDRGTQDGIFELRYREAQPELQGRETRASLTSLREQMEQLKTDAEMYQRVIQLHVREERALRAQAERQEAALRDIDSKLASGEFGFNERTVELQRIARRTLSTGEPTKDERCPNDHQRAGSPAPLLMQAGGGEARCTWPGHTKGERCNCGFGGYHDPTNPDCARHQETESE